MNLPKGIAYIVVAGLAGLVATFSIHQYIKVKTRVSVPVTGQVAVATSDISPGTALDGKLVKVGTWPQNLIPTQTASSFKEIEGRVVKTPLAKGEPILLSKLAPQGTSAGLSGLLGENKRALTVRVDDVSGVAGFIHPGDRVDVLVDMPVPNTHEHISKTFLQNILVLTAGQVWEQKGENKPAVVNTVTLELDTTQAELLNLASNQGKIRLALRNPNNSAAVPTKGVDSSQLIDEQGRKKKGESKKVITVEIIKGMARSEANL
ncbi:MAG: Flp pilus assembly protein CpaB [Desulfobaccales bacterium]|nr:Flp pilus assembly protein CpaB [Desulfobaccales bacterium]